MILVDMLNVAYRNNAKLHRLTASNGQPTGMEYGTLRSLKALLKKYGDTYGRLVLCWDVDKGWRRKRCASYKAGRKPMETKLRLRLKALREALQGIYDTAFCQEFEADDVIMTLAMKNPERHLIVSEDTDLYQAVSDGVDILQKKQVLTRDDLVRRMGFLPHFMGIYKSVKGDTADNIQGIPRIPTKLVQELLADIPCGYSQAKAAQIFWQNVKARALTGCKWCKKLVDESATVHSNYELVNLTPINITYTRPHGNKERMQALLKTLEIKSVSFDD